MTQHNERITAVENHVQFELQSLRGAGLRQTIREEVTALFALFDDVCLDDFTSADMIIDFFQRNVIHRPIPDEIPDFITECAKKIQECLYQDDTILKKVISKKLFDQFIQNTLGIENLRNEMINHVVSSTIFSMLITETLYGGIKAFVVSENLIMKKVPGASSLLSAYKGFLNKTTFGLSDNIAGQIDEQIKKFVKTYIENHLKKSEQFLIDAFDTDMIRKSGAEIWSKAGKYNSRSIAEFVDKGHIDALAQNVRDFWSVYRQTSIFTEISNELITHFFRTYGKKRIRNLLKDMGITPNEIINELEKTAVPIIEKEVVQHYLEKRIRVRLQRFYNKGELNETWAAVAPSDAESEPVIRNPAKTGKKSDMDTVYTFIEESKKGIDSKALRDKTGMENKALQDIIKKLKAQGKISTAGKGIYVVA